MATKNKKRLSKIARQKLELRRSMWPELDDENIWERSKSDGWLSIPRAMPLIMQIMDSFSKGKPISSTYLDIWCRSYDDSFVIANKSREMAFYAGFTGERAERTWASRIDILQTLGFIDVKEGPNGKISYILIFNPYLIIKEKYEAGEVNEMFYNSLKQRMIEIGAHDLD